MLRPALVAVNKVQLSKRISDLLIPFIRKDSYLDKWVVRPMNGQRNRLRTTILLCDLFEPDYVIESGSFLGTTTQYLSILARVKTYSIEINQDFSRVAKTRLSEDISRNRVEIIDGDSATQLPIILEGIDSKDSCILAYLDAHWLEHIPLREELQSLLDWGGDFIAIIDDFYIPTDQGYGYDLYKNHRVDVTHVPISDQISIWIPSESSTEESGAKRGTAYIVSASLKLRIEGNSSDLKLKLY